MADSKPQPAVVDAEVTQSVAAAAHRAFSATSLRGVAGLARAEVAAAPIVIDDLKGPELFHDYALHGADGSVVGTVRTGANRALGSPLVSIAHGAPGWNQAKALRLATEALHRQQPKALVNGSRLVSYAYPKVGIELTFHVGTGKPQTELFDASSGSPVATSTEADHQFTRYSLLDTLKNTPTKVKQFRAAEAQLSKIGQKAFPLQITRQGTVLLSPYCPGSPVGLSHYAQILDYFCVDASAQMLLEHYGWNYTQNQIATAMGTTAAQGGTSGAGLTSGFKSLTDNTLLLTFDDGASRSQQFTDAVTEISANRPLFTQVPHHYRVCVGYSEVVSIILFGGASNQMLYIYDPWPWNPDLCSPGAAYWEMWSSSPVMWFGIVHHA